MHHRDMDTPTDSELHPPKLPADLRTASDADLGRLARELSEQEQVLEERIAPIRTQIEAVRRAKDTLSTEQRRRERMASHATRKALQEAFADASHPLLETALGIPDLFPGDLPLAELTCVLRTGGTVQLGYATKRGTMSFTNGTEVRSATTWGESTALYLDGWQPGTKTLPGVRIVLIESRVERVVPAVDISIVIPQKD